MRRYEMQFGTENEVDGGIAKPVHQEIINAAANINAIELAKASTMRATASAGNLAQLLDDGARSFGQNP
jgi:hypothetical protein